MAPPRSHLRSGAHARAPGGPDHAEPVPARGAASPDLSLDAPEPLRPVGPVAAVAQNRFVEQEGARSLPPPILREPAEPLDRAAGGAVLAPDPARVAELVEEREDVRVGDLSPVRLVAVRDARDRSPRER